MLSIKRATFLLLAALLLPVSAVLGRTPDTAPIPLKVSVFNDIHVSSEILAQAQARATSLMAQAGVNLEWLNCPAADPSDFTPPGSPCSVVDWPRHLSVRIVTGVSSRSRETFGESFLDDAGRGVYAKVYYQNLAASRGDLQLAEGDMLAFVIVHELGHLLLGSNSHSTTGVMQARWTATTLHDALSNTLFFTSHQAATLHSLLSRLPPSVFQGASRDSTHASHVILADGGAPSSRSFAAMTTITTSPPSAVFPRLLPH